MKLRRALEEKKHVLELVDRFLEQPAGEIGVHVGLGEMHPAMRELFLGMIPMKHAIGAEEIAAAAVFLASDYARSINGETIAIDGGSLTRGYPALLTGLKKAS